MGQSVSPQGAKSKRLPNRRHSASQQTAEEFLSRTTWRDALALSPLANFTDQILVLLEQHGNVSSARREELVHLASMLIAAMWRVQERKGGSEASAVAARLDYDIVQRAAGVLANRWATQQKVFRRIRRPPPREVVEMETRDSIAAQQSIPVLELIRRTEMICTKLLRRVARGQELQEHGRLPAGIVGVDKATPQGVETADDDNVRMEPPLSTQLTATPKER